MLGLVDLSQEAARDAHLASVVVISSSFSFYSAH